MSIFINGKHVSGLQTRLTPLKEAMPGQLYGCISAYIYDPNNLRKKLKIYGMHKKGVVILVTDEKKIDCKKLVEVRNLLSYQPFILAVRNDKLKYFDAKYYQSIDIRLQPINMYKDLNAVLDEYTTHPIVFGTQKNNVCVEMFGNWQVYNQICRSYIDPAKYMTA